VNALALAAVAALLLAAEPPPAPPKAGPRPSRLTPGKPIAPPPEPAAATTRDPETEARLLTEQKCTKCHDLSRALSATLTEQGWRIHLKRIGSGGAAISDEQQRKIQAYLRQTVGKASSAGVAGR
jgi:hypothetical protein